VGSVDLPDQPDGPDRTRHVRDSTAGAPRVRELPDPDERARAYEATRVYVSAETRETEPTISSDVRAVEQENRYGGWLEGFDRRLKDEDRLQEKVAANGVTWR
jgi:hypothetical protein